MRGVLVILTAICMAVLGSFGGIAAAFAPKVSLDDIPRIRQEIKQLSAAGKYDEALAGWQKILSIQTELLDPGDVAISQSWMSLASINLHLRNFKVADEQIRKALAIAEKSLGVEHPVFALFLTIHSQTQEALGMPAEAETLQSRAVRILQETLGRDSPKTLTEQNALGALLAGHGKYEAAATILKEAVEAQQDDEPSTRRSLAESTYLLGRVFKEQRKYVESKAMLERSLGIQESLFGKEAPAICRVLDILIEVHVRLGDRATAEQLAVRALSIKERTLPANDLQIAESLNNLAIIVDQLGKHTQAIEFYKRSLKMKEARFGADSLEVAGTMMNLGIALTSDSKYSEAEIEYRRSLDIFERKRGAKSVEAAEVVMNWARLYHLQGRFIDAEPLYRRGLPVLEKTPIAADEKYAQVLDGAADTFEKVGKPDEAAALRLRAQLLRSKK